MTPEKIRTAREALSLTQDEFAQIMGYSGGNTTRRWELGLRKVPPPVSVIIALAERSPQARKILLWSIGR